MLKLRIVIGPFVLTQHFNGTRLKTGDLLAKFQIQTAEIEAGQRGDLIGTAAQRRQIQGEAAQPCAEQAHHIWNGLAVSAGAGEQKPYPAGQSGFLDRGQQSRDACLWHSLQILKVNGIARSI